MELSTIHILNISRQSNLSENQPKQIIHFFPISVGFVFAASSSISVYVQIFINYHRVQLCLGWAICGRHCCDTYYICSFVSCFIFSSYSGKLYGCFVYNFGGGLCLHVGFTKCRLKSTKTNNVNSNEWTVSGREKCYVTRRGTKHFSNIFHVAYVLC